MKLPLQISFKNIGRDEQLTQLIKDKAQKFDRLSPEVIQCRVTITVPHKNHRTGNFFNVRIDISVPGTELAAMRESQDDEDNKDVRHVIKEAFDAAYRQLEDYNRRRNANAA